MSNVMKSLAVGLVFTALLSGCQTTGDLVSELPPAPPRVETPVFNPEVAAGVPVVQDADPQPLQQLVSAVGPRLGSRVDPFALLVTERRFEQDQLAERLFAESGAFPALFEYTPEYEVSPPPVLEPQPYRRLSGVVIGPSVLALLEMNDGNPPVLVRPGMMVPNTEWRVISINEDRAVLRRGGNVLPREITIKLEPAPAGSLPSMGGAPGGGVPGGRQGGPGLGFGGPGGGGSGGSATANE